jgi:hypothetical protein
MTFLLSLWANPVVRKVILYGAALTAILFALRIWGNRQWAAGEAQGRRTMALEMEKTKQAEWKAERDKLAAAAGAVARERVAVEAQASALARTRRELQDTLSRSLNQISLTSKVNNATAIAVPDADLDAALRTLSAELAAAQPR